MVNAWDPGAAVELLEPASEAFADLVADAALADIEHQLARAYWFNDRLEQAVELADRALGRAERIEAVGIIADALITKGVLLAWGSRPYEGTGSVEAGARLAEEHGLHGTHARGLLNLGVIALERQPRLALDRSRAALALAARYGFASSYATALGNAAEAAVCYRGMGLGAGCDDRRGDRSPGAGGPDGDHACRASRSSRLAVSRWTSSWTTYERHDRGDHRLADAVELGLHPGRSRVCGRPLPRRRRRLAAVVRHEHRERVDRRCPGRAGDAVGGRHRRPAGDAARLEDPSLPGSFMGSSTSS